MNPFLVKVNFVLFGGIIDILDVIGCKPGDKCSDQMLQCGDQTNVTKLAPSEKVKIGTRTAHSATEQRLCAVFLKKGMTRKRIEKSAKKSYSKRINYATL